MKRAAIFLLVFSLLAGLTLTAEAASSYTLPDALKNIPRKAEELSIPGELPPYVQITLWKVEENGAIRLELEEPVPRLKIMEQKGFVVKHKSGAGKTFVFSPLMTRERYRRLVVDDVKDTFFGGSVKSLVSFFAEEDELTQEDINEILTILQSRNHAH